MIFSAQLNISGLKFLAQVCHSPTSERNNFSALKYKHLKILHTIKKTKQHYFNCQYKTDF